MSEPLFLLLIIDKLLAKLKNSITLSSVSRGGRGALAPGAALRGAQNWVKKKEKNIFKKTFLKF